MCELQFFFSSRRRHTRFSRDWSSDVCSSDLVSPSRGELPTYIYDADTPRLMATPKHYAYVKIAEGCDYKCAFCIIPTLRGHYRSRPRDSIRSEEHTSELQSRENLVCRLLLEK